MSQRSSRPALTDWLRRYKPTSDGLGSTPILEKRRGGGLPRAAPRACCSAPRRSRGRSAGLPRVRAALPSQHRRRKLTLSKADVGQVAGATSSPAAPLPVLWSLSRSPESPIGNEALLSNGGRSPSCSV